MALYFKCRIDKNTLFQTVFLAILHTGKHLLKVYKANYLSSLHLGVKKSDSVERVYFQGV